MKIQRAARALAAATALLSPLAGIAAPATFTAKISGILLYEAGDLVYIHVEGGAQQKPACATANYLSFSMKRPRAKEYLAGLMVAFTAGKPVFFRTEGACIDQSTSDTLTYFQINNE